MGVIDVIKKHQRIQGREEGKKEFIINLIQDTKFDDARIASLVGTSIERVQEIRTELKKRK